MPKSSSWPKSVKVENWERGQERTAGIAHATRRESKRRDATGVQGGFVYLLAEDVWRQLDHLEREWDQTMCRLGCLAHCCWCLHGARKHVVVASRHSLRTIWAGCEWNATPGARVEATGVRIDPPPSTRAPSHDLPLRRFKIHACCRRRTHPERRFLVHSVFAHVNKL